MAVSYGLVTKIRIVNTCNRTERKKMGDRMESGGPTLQHCQFMVAFTALQNLVKNRLCSVDFYLDNKMLLEHSFKKKHTL